MIVAGDIHLSPSQPRRNARFFDFLRAAKTKTQELYLIGDIFDIWLGDDTGGGFGEQVQGELRAFVSGGARVFLQHGNRDFLLGEQFAASAACELINDEHIIAVGEQRILLTHGDILTSDFAYQCYRKVTRASFAKRWFLSLPKQRRENIAATLRNKSAKNRRIANITKTAAEMLMQKHNCQTLIHGHLHKAQDEQWQSNDKTCRRLCVPDWEGDNPGYAHIGAGGAITAQKFDSGGGVICDNARGED